MSMDRFFRRLPLDKPVIRNNYAFQVVQEPGAGAIDPDELAWAETMNGSEDASEYARAAHANAQADARKRGVGTAATPGTVRLRSERQTLRRLPRTGAIVFTIHVYQTRIADLAGEPGVPGRMASALRSWPEDVAR